MAVIMRGMIVPGVVGMSVRRVRVGARIGAAFGIERRLDLDHARAQAIHHRLDDVIAPDPQAFCHDLRRQVTIAEMPGNANQMARVLTPDFDQRLRRRDHFDQPVVVEHQGIAAAQRDGVFQVEQELKPARTRHRHPPPVTVVEIEHDGVGRRFRPMMLALNSRRSDHG